MQLITSRVGSTEPANIIKIVNFDVLLAVSGVMRRRMCGIRRDSGAADIPFNADLSLYKFNIFLNRL